MIVTNIGKSIIIVFIAIAVVVALYLLLTRWPGVRDEETPPVVQQVPEETRSVTLFFAGRQADRLLSETREIPAAERIEDQVHAVITELVLGPEDRAMVSTIPRETEVLQVFWVEESQTIFIDFNRAFVTNHPGGSTGEYYTIATIVRTVGANFPQVRMIQFLVDGSTTETVAGHYAVDEAIDVRKWQ